MLRICFITVKKTDKKGVFCQVFYRKSLSKSTLKAQVSFFARFQLFAILRSGCIPAGLYGVLLQPKSHLQASIEE